MRVSSVIGIGVVPVWLPSASAGNTCDRLFTSKRSCWKNRPPRSVCRLPSAMLESSCRPSAVFLRLTSAAMPSNTRSPTGSGE